MNQPTPDPSAAITRQIDQTARANNARAADEQARRAASLLAADLDDLRAVVGAIANQGVSTGRIIESEGHAAAVADTLAAFFAAMSAMTGANA